MTHVEAIYQNGVFQPVQDVKLPENQRVRLSIEPVAEDEIARARQWLAESSGDAATNRARTRLFSRYPPRASRKTGGGECHRTRRPGSHRRCRNMIAQGNALGGMARNEQALRGANKTMRRITLFCLFRVKQWSRSQPQAGCPGLSCCGPLGHRTAKLSTLRKCKWSPPPTAKKPARSSKSSARPSTPSSRRATCPKSTTPSRSTSDYKGVKIQLTGEVQQHLGGNRVRCRRARLHRRLDRGMKVVDTGNAVPVPVGKETLGRVFNLLGDPIDGRGPVNAEETRPIHREPPQLLPNCRRRPSCSRPASRSSTCSRRSSAAARRACSAVPGSARPSSSPN